MRKENGAFNCWKQHWIRLNLGWVQQSWMCTAENRKLNLECVEISHCTLHIPASCVRPAESFLHGLSNVSALLIMLSVNNEKVYVFWEFHGNEFPGPLKQMAGGMPFLVTVEHFVCRFPVLPSQKDVTRFNLSVLPNTIPIMLQPCRTNTTASSCRFVWAGKYFWRSWSCFGLKEKGISED